MWFGLSRGDARSFRVTNRQSIWPAPDGSDAELVITTQSVVHQDVILSTPRVVRLRYTIKGLVVTMTLGDQPPAPWQEASAVNGRSFEVMLTEKGALVAPAEGPKLPNRLHSWLNTVAEDVRSSWCVPPARARPGTRWSMMPAVPGGLPPGTTSATVKVAYHIESIDSETAAIGVQFGVKVVLESQGPTKRGEGRGDVSITLSRELGLTSATRQGRMEIVRPYSRNQVLRSMMELSAG